MEAEPHYREVKLKWIKSNQELEKIFGKRSYEDGNYNNCSEFLHKFYESLFLHDNTTHGNIIFIQLDPSLIQPHFEKLQDGRLKEKFTFSGALNEHEWRKHFKSNIMFRVKKTPEKKNGYECWYSLNMCEDYKEAFKRRTGNRTCPVKWFYEQHFNFGAQSACIVDRAIAGQPLKREELEVFYKLPIIMSPTTPRCGCFMPRYRDTEDAREHLFQMKNYEYLIVLDGITKQNKEIVLYAF